MAFEHGFRGKKPVEEGKEYTVTITDIGSQGDGIARVEGFVVFVPETKVGQSVKIKITRVGNKSAFAKVVE
jgi:predicted RNA-binding protein with TRAM domain